MKKDGRRTGERKKDGWTGGRAGGRTDGRRAGGEFREKRRAMGKEVVRFWSSKKTKEVEFGIRGRFDLNKVCGSK